MILPAPDAKQSGSAYKKSCFVENHLSKWRVNEKIYAIFAFNQ